MASFGVIPLELLNKLRAYDYEEKIDLHEDEWDYLILLIEKDIMTND